MSGFLNLGQVADALAVEAHCDRWRVTLLHTGAGLQHPTEWPAAWLDSPEAWQLARQLAYLLEIGVAEISSDEISIPWDRFESLIEGEFSLPFLWSAWSSFRILLSGGPEKLRARFFLGGVEAGIERAGRYVRRLGHQATWLLDNTSFEMLDVLEHPRLGEQRWITLGFLSGYVSELCAGTKGWLAGNEVTFPQELTGKKGEARWLSLALAMRNRGTRHVKALAHSGRWQHIVLDDEQIAALDQGSDRPSAHALSTVGRIGKRCGIFDSQPELLPAFLSCAPPPVYWKPTSVRPYARVRTLRRSHLEALVAGDFSLRGYDTILLPRGCWTGASMIAFSDQGCFLVRIEPDTAGEDALLATVRMAHEHRRLLDVDFRVALIAPNGCDLRIRRRAEAADIRVLTRKDLISATRVSEEDIQDHSQRHCRSLREGVEQLLFAGF